MMDAQRVLLFMRPDAIPNEHYFASGDMFQWIGPGVAPTPAEMADAELPAAKHWQIAANRAKCQRRIYERYPAWRQASVALGVLTGPVAEARAAEMRDWISAMVGAENTAADAIEAATTVQAVEAVSVSWPA